MITAAVLLAAAPVSLVSRSPELDFAYRWSAEAEAVPALARRFRADAAAQKREMLKTARAEREVRRRMGAEFNGLQFSREWATAGQSSRLLSLLGETSAFTGGAHPNGGSTALLWDRRLARQVPLGSLLRSGQSWTGAIRQPFCLLLDRERTKRRQQKVVRGEWPNQCPETKELSLVLTDRNRNGRFDHIEVIADSYVAGPYAEGSYEITLPLTAAMLSRLKPEYAPSFEPQPPVQ